MKKINILITGQLKNKKNLLKTLYKFRNLDFIDQIIISTWTEEVNNNKFLFSILNKLKVDVVSQKSDVYKNSFFYQSKSLENGLANISNKNLDVFKTRTDLFIDTSYLKKIIDLDYSLNNKSIFSKKVWIPFFEISKPVYFGDECIYANYKDLSKLYNYEEKYDHWQIGPGCSHIRRFIDPYINFYQELEIIQRKHSVTNHGSSKRFPTLNKLLLDKEYLNFLFFNYLILKNEFRVGLENTESYIFFREWSSGKVQPKESEFYKSFDKKNSFNPSLGQIFSYDETWLTNIINNSDFSEEIINNKIYKQYQSTF